MVKDRKVLLLEVGDRIEVGYESMQIQSITGVAIILCTDSKDNWIEVEVVPQGEDPDLD